MNDNTLVRDLAKKLELEPCPFCGDTATIESMEKGYSAIGEFTQVFRCGCRECNMWFSYKSRFVLVGSDIRFIEDGYTKAIEHWNRRIDIGRKEA